MRKTESKVSVRQARLDDRPLNYRFHLERDLPWEQAGENGLFFGSHFLSRLGLLPAAFDAQPDLQWALAVITARAFIALEEDILAFTKGSTGSRSVVLLVEEERKHIELFQRVLTHLYALHPERRADVDAVWWRPVSWDDLRSQSAIDDPQHVKGLFWLTTLFFEEYTVWIQDALERNDEHFQPLWFAAHGLPARPRPHQTSAGRGAIHFW